MIEFKHVTKRFGDKLVLDRVSFQINRGEIVFVIGKSGMGKSVLLKNIVGLIRPDEGEIWVENQEVGRLRESEYFQVRKLCGMVFQYPALLDSLTVFENVAFGVRAHRLCSSEEELKKRVREKLRLAHLSEEIFPLFPTELSYGMQKRVSIARTLAVEPNYLLFDEPTTGLDPVATNGINDLIFRLSRTLKVTSVVVSHDMHCAIAIADRIFLLHEGKMIAEGPPSDMVYSSQPLVQEFMKEAKEKMGDR